MPSVLFVCTANKFRSPLAQAIFQKLIQQQGIDEAWEVSSAGTWTQNGEQAATIAQQVANQLGLDGLDEHRTQQIDANILDHFDLILVMENGHKEAITSEFSSANGRVFLLSELVTELQYDIPDPVEPSISPEGVGRELMSLIENGKSKIIQLAELNANRLSDSIK